MVAIFAPAIIFPLHLLLIMNNTESGQYDIALPFHPSGGKRKIGANVFA